MPQRPRPDRSTALVPETVKIKGPLGIIAGRGSLPCVLAETASARGLPFHIVGIHGEAEDEIERFPHTWVKWGEVGKMFYTLEENGCADIVIIGGVNRPDFSNVRLDSGALKTLPFILSLSKGGDDHVLSRVVRFFEQKGYRVHGVGDVAPELLAEEGVIGSKTPSPEDDDDIELALRVIDALGRLDVGQAAVVAKGYVIAVEAAEGTDAMLTRCIELRETRRTGRPGRAGVLVKAPKPGQEERVDLPTIGPNTVLKSAAAGLAGIAVAAGHVLIAERDATIAAADQNGLFLLGVTLDKRGG
jgi:UDP-2,3-diacylglucosamine hydrolase